MIYTVTFNPSLDYTVKVEDFREGMVNRTAFEAVSFGGKGVNVSCILRNLGLDNVALGFIAGFTGKEIERRVRAAGIRSEFIELHEGFSRINVKLKAGQETEINGKGNSRKCGGASPSKAGRSAKRGHFGTGRYHSKQSVQGRV